jgi:hypothetical protein
VWRGPEGAPKLAAEVGAAEPCRRGQVVDPERFRVAGIGEVLGAGQVAGGRDEGDGAILGAVGECAGAAVGAPEPCLRVAMAGADDDPQLASGPGAGAEAAGDAEAIDPPFGATSEAAQTYAPLRTAM